MLSVPNVGYVVVWTPLGPFKYQTTMLSSIAWYRRGKFVVRKVFLQHDSPVVRQYTDLVCLFDCRLLVPRGFLNDLPNVPGTAGIDPKTVLEMWTVQRQPRRSQAAGGEGRILSTCPCRQRLDVSTYLLYKKLDFCLSTTAQQFNNTLLLISLN